MALVRVVLPHPLGPTRPNISPRSIRISMPLSATIPPKRRSTDRHSSTGPALSPAKSNLSPPGVIDVGSARKAGHFFLSIDIRGQRTLDFHASRMTARHLVHLGQVRAG